MFYIYCHRIISTGEIFYIGKGTKRRAWNNRSRNKFWINIVNKHQYAVEILLDNLNETSAYIQEYFFIKHYKPRTNICIGGSGGNSEIIKAKWNNVEFRNKMTRLISDAWKNPSYKRQVSEKISQSLTGKKLSPKHREKAILNLKKYSYLRETEYAKKKKSLALSKALKGRKLNQEWIDRIVASKKGIKRSNNTNLQQAITSGSKPFLVYDNSDKLVDEWINKEQCARDLGFSDGCNIGRCLRKQRKSYKGFKFIIK